MKTHTRTVVAAVFAAISVLIVSSASAEVTKATVDTNAIRSALKGVPPVELSAKAAKIVSKAEKEKQVVTAVETMRVVVKKNPAVVVTVASPIVSTIVQPE